MAFQIKDFASITASQINYARAVTDKITDFQPGSVVRTIMEAPAVEMEELYMQFFLGLRDAIPVATFLSFGFDKLPAALARGFVTVSKVPAPSADQIIPAGTQFSTIDGRIYYSSGEVTWNAGANSVRIDVEASGVGLSGNIAENVIVSSSFFNEDYTIGNSAITTGRDAESDREREARFAEFVKSLSRGTVVACQFAVGGASVLDEDGNISEYVTRVGIHESAGRVSYFLYGSGGVPSDALIEDAQRKLDGHRDNETGVVTPGYRSAGVRVDALKMVERAISASFSVEMFQGYALTDTVRQSLADVFATAIRGVMPGETLYIGTLVELMLGVSGVRSVVPAVNENIFCAANEALIPGELNISIL